MSCLRQFTGFKELTMDDLIEKLKEQYELEDRMVEEEVRSIGFRIEQLEPTKTSSEESESIETLNLTKKRVEEKWKVKKMEYLAKIKRIFEYMNCTSAQSGLKLHFRHKISTSILTGQDIKGDGDMSIEVALVDDTGHIVDTGPAASAIIEIVVLKGEAESCEGVDLSVEEFNGKIVQEMQGKEPILKGNVRLKLQRGVVVLDNIKFRNHAVKMKPPVFRLGARVIDQIFGVCVKEARTEPFTVKDYRNKYIEKHEIPFLSDEVFRLVNIGKRGEIEKRLAVSKIYTVEDFLIQLLIDPEGLKRIVDLPRKKWKKIVDHARKCPSDKRMYCYINSQQKTGVVFNVLGEVLGLYLKSHYARSNMSENHKADAQELLASAYKQWEDVKSFDNEISLHRHVCGLIPSIKVTDCVVEEFYCALIGESGNEHSNCSFQRRISQVNSNGHFSYSTVSCSENIGDTSSLEAGLIPDLDSLNQYDNRCSQTIDTIDKPLQYCEKDHSLQIPNLESSIDEDLQYFKTDSHLQSQDSEFSAYIQGSINAFASCLAVPIDKDQSGWNTLFIVLKWLLSIKRIVAPNTSVRKKIKILSIKMLH